MGNLPAPPPPQDCGDQGACPTAGVPAEEEEEHSSQSSDSDLRHRDQNDGPAHNIQQENFKKNAKAAITK